MLSSCRNSRADLSRAACRREGVRSKWMPRTIVFSTGVSGFGLVVITLFDALSGVSLLIIFSGNSSGWGTLFEIPAGRGLTEAGLVVSLAGV